MPHLPFSYAFHTPFSFVCVMVSQDSGMQIEGRQRGIILRFPEQKTQQSGPKDTTITPEHVGTILLYRHEEEVGNRYAISSRSARRFVPYMFMMASMHNIHVREGPKDPDGNIHEFFMYAPLNFAEQQLCARIDLQDDGVASEVSFLTVPRAEHPLASKPKPHLHVVRDE